MDIGTFKASKGRLMAWIIIPPLLMVGVGLSAYAWQLKAKRALRQNQTLSNVLPVFIKAQRDSAQLISDLGIGDEETINTEDQLISYLQEAALKRGFTVEAVQVTRHEKGRDRSVPALRAQMEGFGNFNNIQLYMNEIKSTQQLLAISSIELTQAEDALEAENIFNARIVFELLLADEVLKSRGGHHESTK